MKKTSTLFVLILLAINLISAQDTLRILTYNIEVGYEANMDAIGKYIKSIKPDLVALQEVDEWAYRSNNKSKKGVNQIVELAHYADMFPIFAKTRDLNESNKGGYYGIGLLSKYPIISYKRILLPQKNMKYEPRVMIIAEIDIHGTIFTFVNTHLTLDNDDRLLQGKFIAKQLKKIKGPKIICGDFNSIPEEPTMAKALSKYTDALPTGKNTYPAVTPRAKVDYILFSHKDNIKIINQSIDTSCNLSDHCPCYIDIVINK